MLGVILTADANITTTLVQLVGSLGFPIVAWFLMFKQNERLEARHEEESKNFVAAINNNTMAIQQLVDKLGKEN